MAFGPNGVSGVGHDAFCTNLLGTSGRGWGSGQMGRVGRDAFCIHLANFTNKAEITNKLTNSTNKIKITNKLVILAWAFRFRSEYPTGGMGLFGAGLWGWGSGQMKCLGLTAIPFTQI